MEDETGDWLRALKSSGLLLVTLLGVTGCLQPTCETEQRILTATADLVVPSGDSVRGGSFRYRFEQTRGQGKAVSVAFAFDLGSLQDSIASAIIRDGEAADPGRVLFESPTYLGPDGPPERVQASQIRYPGPLDGDTLIQELASGPSHLQLSFIEQAADTAVAPLEVSGLTEWRSPCESR